MPHLSAPSVVVSGTKILASKYNADIGGLVSGINASVQFVDVSAVNTVTNTWTALQTLSGGLAVTGGNLTVTNNQTIGGTLAVTGLVTIGGTLGVTGQITGNVTGNLTGNVTGNLTGNVTGNVSGTSGSTTGNAATATALQTGRTINGVTFDGTGNITVTAAAGTLTGTAVNATVVTSSLTTFGTLAGNLIFTDNTYDIGASGATRPRTLYAGTSVVTPLLNNSGSTITLRGVTYTLPAADGTSGQVLQTNGSAVLSWAAASSGFVTGSGTTGTIPKFTGSAALGNSILTEATGVLTVGGTLVVTGASVTLGTTPATAGVIRIPAATALTSRNNANSANVALISLQFSGGSDVVQLGGMYNLPAVDGTNGYVLSTNGSGSLSWIAQSGGGGISGLTTGKLPKAASSTTLTDSLLSESGATVSVGGNLTLTGTFALNVGGASLIGGTLGVTGNVLFGGTLGVTSNTTIGGTLTTTGLFTSSGNTLISGTCTVGGNSFFNGNTTIGDATTDTLTVTATIVSDLLPTTATYNLGSAAKKWNILYLFDHVDVGGSQVVGSRVTGFAPTWNAVYAANKNASLGPLTAPTSLSVAASALDLTALGTMVKAMYDAMYNSTGHGLIGA